MRTTPFDFECDDGALLNVYRWEPDEPTAVRGVVLIAHGLAEHAKRYEGVGAFLVDAGYAVFAPDHRGHGKTFRSGTDLGYFTDEDGWNRVVKDLHQLNRHLAELHPEQPIFLLGHSMGSFLTQQYLYEYPETIAGAVLSGSNGPAGILEKAGRFVVRIERARQGKNGRSGLVNKLSFGSFNNDFKPARTPFDWLSRDPAEVEKYIGDPLCGFVATNQLWFDFLGGLVELGKPENVARIPKDMPIYAFSGDLDPVGGAGKGFNRLMASYRKAGLTHVEGKLYAEARHEMFNEVNRDEVMQDLARWFDGVLASRPG